VFLKEKLGDYMQSWTETVVWQEFLVLGVKSKMLYVSDSAIKIKSMLWSNDTAKASQLLIFNLCLIFKLYGNF